MADGDTLDELRDKVALSCRILAMAGLVKEITGHVSVRIPDSPGEMFLRCRGDDEYGLPFTGPSAVRRLTLDGQGEGLGATHEKPLELPIHGELLRARPEINCVIHAHPPGVLLCGIAGVELRPIYGAYDPGGLALAVQGIPTFPSSVLISNPELGQKLAATMGEKPVCVMRGHGIAVVGRSIEEATIRAIRLEALARISWQLSSKGQVAELPAEDIASFQQRGPGQVLSRADEWVWRHYVRLLEEKAPGADEAFLTSWV